jgi:hypothetical protein
MGSMAGRGSGDISIHHNLFAHNNRRNPRIKTTDGVVDFANNVLYNYGAAAGECTDDEGPIDLNFRGNFIKDGPDNVFLPLNEEENSILSLFLQDNLRLRFMEVKRKQAFAPQTKDDLSTSSDPPHRYEFCEGSLPAGARLCGSDSPQTGSCGSAHRDRNKKWDRLDY